MRTFNYRSETVERERDQGGWKMLVLSRKPGQTIHLGSDIAIKVVRVKGNQVRIGVEAPQDVRVRRGELPPPVVLENDFASIVGVFECALPR
jgi:carbon storage regulator